VILLGRGRWAVRICIAGLWHLGVVTATCVAAAGHQVVAFDEDEAIVAGLTKGVLPVDEPGLAELMQRQLSSGHLRFTTQREQALRDADVLWITYDTPVDAKDRADVEFVISRAKPLIDSADPSADIIISSQLPVGTTRRLEESSRPRRTFAYSPENLRLGDAVSAFTQPERIVVGIRSEADRRRIEELLGAFSNRIEWMGVESAELVKHGLNAFLAMSIAFANELAGIAERVGADASEVERGLKTERRIGARAYLHPGAAYAGGTLARDVGYLTQIGRRELVPTNLLAAISTSNDEHTRWAWRTIETLLGDGSGRLDGHTIGIWGLAYKPGTDTLRGSSSVELCRELARAGAIVKAHDASVRVLPDDVSEVLSLRSTPLEVAEGASALVIETDWPRYREVDTDRLVASMQAPNVVDANGFLAETLDDLAGVRYIRVGSKPR
jgi:UDPglucose 6-dehydrogenase